MTLRRYLYLVNHRNSTELPTVEQATEYFNLLAPGYELLKDMIDYEMGE